MKKIVIAFLSIIFAVSCAIGISACNVKPNNGNVEMPHVHNYGEWIITKSATCTEDGAQSRYCVCGDVQTIPLGATGHSLQSYAAQAPTCTEKGWDAYDNCKNCEYTTYSEISALGHDIVHHEGQAATYSDDGWEEYDTCSRCDYSTYKKVPALKHNLVEHSGQAATCTDNGWDDYVTCTDCDYSTYKIIPALGHSVQLHSGKEPTCTEKGWKAYETCARCDYSTYEELSALGHSVQLRAGQEPTCTEKGWKAYETCARCDYSTYGELSALGHSVQPHAGQEPTCTDNGWRAYETCARCDYSTYEELSALGHFVQSHAGQEPTCTEKGWKAYETCTRCDYSTFEELSAMGHDFSGIYHYDSSVHWHECLNDCGATDGEFKHVFTGDDSCSACGYAVSYTQNLAYTLADDGTYYKLSGIGDAVGTCVRSLPEVNGKPVKEVEANAFADNAEITELYLPESVTEIGASAFENCRNLAIINLFDKYTSIGERAFAGTAYYNERANWEDNILYIGANLISVRTTTLGITNIKEGTTIIADGAYSGCANVVGLEIPDSVRYIGENVFNGCTSIEELALHDSIIGIGDLVGLTSLKTLDISARFKQFIPQTIQNLTILSGEISEGAFRNFDSLVSVTVENEVNSIGKGAFYGCNKIKNITLPFIGSCRTAQRRWEAVFGYIFGYIHESMREEKAPSGTTCQYSESDGGVYTDYWWYYIPRTIKKITVTGGDLPYNAFKNCDFISEIILCDGVTSIGSNVFSECSSLTSISIPATLTSIGGGSFYRCLSLESVYISDIAAWCNINFNDYCSAYSLYLNGELLTETVIPKTVTKINNNVFSGCKSLKSISIPEGVTQIGRFAFYSCSNLSSISIPDSVTQIGHYAFCECSKLTNIVIPKGVTQIGDGTFSGCSQLISVEIPEGVTQIGSRAFYGCSNLSSISIPDSVTQIGSRAFDGCNIAVTIYDNAKYIGNYSNPYMVLMTVIDRTISTCKINNQTRFIDDSAFYGCNELTEIDIPEGVIRIGEYVFYGCSNLKSVKISEGVTEIGAYAFENCRNLTNIRIPNSILKVGRGAFVNCNNLIQTSDSYIGYYLGNESNPYLVLVEVSKSIESYIIHSDTKIIALQVCSGSFYDVVSLKSISIPKSVICINEDAFYNCVNLTYVYYDGSISDWENISIESKNSNLIEAKIYYSSENN